ncbi:MAG TPA: hypothetical protein VMU15_00755 [Anaeromyxobacter sp.]|nr:hypothetical protein [Anaeromyxobacter sp.]
MDSVKIFWTRTEDGWAVNLDGTDAAKTFSLPRIELHASPRGWSCVCHLANGTSRPVPLGHLTTAAAALRAGIEGSLLAVGPQYELELRALLGTQAGA